MDEQHPLVKAFVAAAKRDGHATYSEHNFAVIEVGKFGRVDIRVDDKPKPRRRYKSPPSHN